jgi:hypothetical protein
MFLYVLKSSKFSANVQNIFVLPVLSAKNGQKNSRKQQKNKRYNVLINKTKIPQTTIFFLFLLLYTKNKYYL